MALRTSLILDLAGNIRRRSREFAQSIDRLGRSGNRSLQLLRTGTSAASRGLDRLGNRYTALIGGAAGIGAARQVINLERRFTRLGIQANRSADDMQRLKEEVFATAQAPEIRVDPSQITAAIEAIVEKTGDLDFARDNIRNIALALQATGAEGAAVGELTAELQKMGIVLDGDVLTAIDTLNKQGKEGAFTLQNLAALGPRLFAAYGTTGRGGLEAVAEIGALAQVIRQATGNSEQATTSFEALLRTLQDVDKVKLLQKNGIRVFEPDQPGVMRDIGTILTDIVTATKGDALKISSIFDAEAMRAFNASIGEFKRTGAVGEIERFKAVAGTGATTIADAARAADDAASAMQNLATAWGQFADRNLSGPIRDLADALNALDPDRVQQTMKWLAWGAGALGGLVLANKALKGIGRTIQLGQSLRGGGGAGAGGVSSALLGVQPVRVVNWPAGGRGGAGLDMAGSRRGGAARGAGRLARFGRAAGRFGPLMAMLAAVNLAGVWTGDGTTRQKTKATAGVGGGLAGGLAGAKGGAALGALGGPAAPITVPIGALLGGGLGYFLGDRIAAELASLVLGEDRAATPAEAHVTVDLNGLPPGSRVRTAPSAGVNLDLNTGYSMVSP